MEKARRDNLRSVIGQARTLVRKSLEQQLARYGLFPDAPRQEWATLALADDQAPYYGRLLDAVRREARAVGAEGEATPAAVGRFIREAGGTWVNRLAALRALEARGLLVPAAVRVSEDYGGLSPRAAGLRDRAAAGGRSLAKDDALRAGIEDACRELSAEVRVLFDLTDEQSLMWPGTLALREILDLFASTLTEDDWSQPDILGWVYQYYNTEANAELKRRKSRTRGFKYTADDIPIANQFYTPHWVVRVLADNTLGRLWLESTGRHPELEELPASPVKAGDAPAWHLVERRKGVPDAAREADAFKAWIAEEPDPLTDVTVDRLCRFLVPLPSRPPSRPRKRARNLRVFDPACGSGHFLLYAFDLLFAMYREDEPDLDLRLIPSLILANNLHGVDIDLRAAQLAAFNLYLKARVTLAAIDPAAKLDLTRLNIVVADAHIGDDPRREAFLARYKSDPEVQTLYRKILADVDDTNLLGSLLKVRTEFEGLFTGVRGRQPTVPPEVKKAWAKKQPELFAVAPQREIAEVFTSFSGREWTLPELLADLRRFEAEVAPQQDVGAKLFLTDLERTVGLLGLLSQQYDVVLMNPPYGDMPEAAKDYLKGNKKKKIPAHYPRTSADLYAAFIEQALELAVPNGLVGALVPWTYTYLSSLVDLRTQILCEDGRPEFLQEYGYGILDGATVGTVGSVVRKLDGQTTAPGSHRCVFERLSPEKRDTDKEVRFRATLPTFSQYGPSAEIHWFAPTMGSLRDVPGMPYAYWASDTLRALFRRFPPLDRDQKGVLVEGRPDVKVADAMQGMATADDPRFLRHWWEIRTDRIGRGRRWVPFSKGGAAVHFYARTDLLVNWEHDGKELKEWASFITGGHWSKRVYSVGWFFMPGLTYPPVSWRLRRFGLLPPDNMFGHGGCCVFLKEYEREAMLGVLNSGLLNALMIAITPERNWWTGTVGALPIALAGAHSRVLVDCATGLERLNRSTRHEGDETCRDFVVPDLLRDFRAAPASRVDLAGLIESWRATRDAQDVEGVRLLEALDTTVEDLYELSASDRQLVRRELARRTKVDGHAASEDSEDPEGESEEGDASPELHDEAAPEDAPLAPPALTRTVARDLASRWLSYYLKQTLESDDDGIVPLSAGHGESALILRLRATMERDLGNEAAAELEAQVPVYLGTADVAEWLAASREETVEVGGKTKKVPVGFCPWHVSLYENRPIFWLLSSEGFEKGKTRLTFRAYLHYLKLTPDTLPRLVAYYLDPVVDSVEEDTRRARDAEAVAQGKAKKGAADLAQEWTNTLAALKAFRAALQAVIEGPAVGERVSEKAKWLPRTIAAVRGGQDVGHGYQPDIDHGVRVNIAPLVEKKLLPRSVLKRLGGG